MEKLVTLPPSVVVSLSRTHPLFQNDKVILSYEAAELIASTVEIRIKQIIDVSKTIMASSVRPAHSNVLIPDDVRNALSSLNIQDLEGYSNSYDYRYIWSTKLYKGNRVVKRESSYKTTFDQQLWGRVRLSQVLKQDFQRPSPSAPGLTVSWAVVHGKVPLVSNRLVKDVTKDLKKSILNNTIQDELKQINFLDYAETEEKLDNIKTLAREIQVVESDLTDGFTLENLDKALLDAIKNQLVSDKQSAKSMKFVVPKIQSVLSKDNRFFLKEMRNILKRSSFSLRPELKNQSHKVVEILRNSMGLDQLLPELCHIFNTEINKFKSTTSVNLHILLQYIEALTSNTNMQIHHYVHQMLVPLLEILFYYDSETNLAEAYRSLSLRKLASKCINNISRNLKRNNNGLENIDNYLVKLYKNELVNRDCSLKVMYGALCGISQLPLLARRVVFYPLVPLLLSLVVKKQSKLVQHSSKNASNEKSNCFKQLLLHEILQLVLEIMYYSSFEDVLSTLEDTGVFMTISYQANELVKDILGSVSPGVNPELILQIYLAIINKCQSMLTTKYDRTSLKRRHDQMTSEDLTLEDLEDEEHERELPEVNAIKRNYQLYNIANQESESQDQTFTTDQTHYRGETWNDFRGVNSMTITF